MYRKFFVCRLGYFSEAYKLFFISIYFVIARSFYYLGVLKIQLPILSFEMIVIVVNVEHSNILANFNKNYSFSCFCIILACYLCVLLMFYILFGYLLQILFCFLKHTMSLTKQLVNYGEIAFRDSNFLWGGIVNNSNYI